MDKKLTILIAMILFSFIILMAYFLIPFELKDNSETNILPNSFADNSEASSMANPASVYCEEQGNTLDIRTDSEGNQYGVCISPDEKECEEWAYYQGNCTFGGEE